MKRYRIRKGSFMDWLLAALAAIAWVVAMSIPSTIENLMGWM